MQESQEAEKSVAAPAGQIDALKSLDNPGRAGEFLERATALAEQYPGDAVVHLFVGVANIRSGKPDDAIVSFTKALAIEPNYAMAHCNLCALYERLNKIPEAERALEQARQHGLQDNPRILVLSAQLSSRQGEFTEALASLNKVAVSQLPLNDQREYHGLLAKTYQSLNRFEEAFSHFATQNRIAKTMLYRRGIDPMITFNSTVQLLELWTAVETVGLAADLPSIAGTSSPAFLVGFPRSGTTLLDTILDSHPEIAVAEEKPMVDEMRRELGRSAPTSERNRLTVSDLETDAFGALRKSYFDELGRHVAESDREKLIVDKNPLNMLDAGLVHRVFPKSKFLFMLRHPCDCVLSCFMQNFRLNTANANFVTLDRTARFYSAVMELWAEYRKTLALDVYTVRYEDLVQDLRGVCAPLIEFLGLTWDDTLLNYRDKVWSRNDIEAPSYRQVVQPLYKQASGRWENYRAQMEPVLPVLRPWIEKFGYAD